MLKQPRKPSRWKCWLGIVIGLAAILMCAYESMEALSLLRYQATQGMVLATRINVADGVKGGKMYYPIVEYQYQVDGIVFQSDVYSSIPSEQRGDDDFANEVLLQFRPFNACTVYFNPSNPQVSTLSINPGRGYWGMMIFTAIMASSLVIHSSFQLRELARGGIIRPGESA